MTPLHLHPHTPDTSLNGLSTLEGLLKPSPRMPTVFVGHGSPMNAIEDNHWRRSWQTLGQQFGTGAGSKYPTPQLILCVSAHWLTRGWHLTGMAWPSTIHDFGGFPQALFDVEYPAPGWPEAAQGLGATLHQPHTQAPLGVDTHQWGLDHGAWSVLQPMFPAANIPVMQLSMDYSRPASEHLALGQQLRALRERGVLIVGSGNIVHNLRAMVHNAADHQAHDWALEFDALTARHALAGNTTALAGLLDGGHLVKQAHPSHEHYLPLLYTAGAAHTGEVPVFFNEGFQMGAISMRSVVWG
jgi:4,5-DOPA dioxygenase extradiol